MSDIFECQIEVTEDDIRQIYSLQPSSSYLKRNWEDECVVYTIDSGETHLLNAIAARILATLERESAAFAALLGEVQEQMGGPENTQAVTSLREVLDSLSKLGIIQACEEVS